MQNLAAGARPAPRRFEPEQIRDRAYAVGAGLAALLDRLEPGWSAAFDRSHAAALDAVLARAAAGPASPCAWPPGELAGADRRAREEAAAIERSRSEARRAFDAQDGWRIAIAAGGEPLWPKGFDPLNVRQVGPGAILHARFVELSNGAGKVHVLGRAALSEAAGKHPLFEGIRTLTIAGLPAEPPARQTAGRIAIRADGVTIEARGALERDAARRLLRIRLR